MAYCGTNDLFLVYHQYETLMGSANVNTFIGAADQWLAAEFYSHSMSPPPPDPMSGTYDYFLRYAAARQAVYMAADSLLSERTDTEGAWWSRYGIEAANMIADIRSGVRKLSYQSSTWQDSISPAVPWINGTIAAPPANVLHTNGLTGGRYTADIPRHFEVQIDGSTGADISDYTYRYRIVGTSAWMGAGQPCDVNNYVLLGWNVHLLWTPPVCGSLTVGQRWRIYCVPKGEAVNSGGAKAIRRNWA